MALGLDGAGQWSTFEKEIKVAIASCAACGSRPRVLPCDVLPRKPYSLPVIEKAAGDYSKGGESLREISWRVPRGARTLSHTTLHAWTEGLGAFALGRDRETLRQWEPASRLLRETKVRHPGLDTRIDAKRFVDERRYRSEGRRERLSALASFLLIAGAVTGAAAPFMLLEWRRLCLGWSLPNAFTFRTGFSHTRIEQVGRRSAAGSGPKSRNGPDRCLLQNRSPPGATS